MLRLLLIQDITRLKKFNFFILTFSLCANMFAQSNEWSSIETWKKSNIENVEIINSAEEEFSPHIWSDYLIYISVQEKVGLNKKGPVYFDIKASLLEDTASLKNFIFNSELNSQYHDGPISWNQSSNKLFFTRGNAADKQPVVDAQGRQLLYIYEADYAQGKWNNIEKLSFCTEEENYCHPATYNNGRSLIFASTIPGGSGKMDLYKTDRISEFTWSTPINLGKQVNNPGNDWFPFVYDNTLLFYASDLKDGMGLDIYLTTLDAGGNAGPIVRLPAPINSEYDDFGLVISNDKKEAFFSSNRPGGKGKDDVYRITFDQEMSVQSAEPKSTKESMVKKPALLTPANELKILITDQQLKKGIANANISIYVLPRSTADNFIQQLDSNSDISLLETMAKNIASSISYESNTNGSLKINLPENEHLFIVVKKSGYKSTYHYMNTNDAHGDLMFEMER